MENKSKNIVKSTDFISEKSGLDEIEKQTKHKALKFMDVLSEKAGLKKSFNLSSLDIFGRSVGFFSWDRQYTYKTKVGVFFTLLFYAMAGYMLLGSMQKFLFQQSPNVIYGNYFELISKEKQLNLVTTTFPWFIMRYNSGATNNNEQYIDASEILCNFDIYARKKNIYPGYLPLLGGEALTVGAYCADHVNKNISTVNGVAQHQLGNGYTFGDDDQNILSTKGICIKENYLAIYGDPNENCWTTGECQFYTQGFKFKDSSARASCPRSQDINNVEVQMFYYNVDLRPEDNKNPWAFNVNSKSFQLFDDTRVNISVENTKLKLVSVERQFGMLIDQQKEQSKMNIQITETSYSRGTQAMEGGNLNIDIVGAMQHTKISREYVTFMDCLSYFGGLFDFIVIPFTFFYTFYNKKSFKNDMVYRGVLISGKFRLDTSSSKYQHDVYHEKVASSPKVDYIKICKGFFSKFITCFSKIQKFLCFCSKKKEEKSESKDDEHDLYDKAFKSILDRQLDLKHILQLSQDVEIIKKVLFEERHIVLSSLLTIEAEKRYLKLVKSEEENNLKTGKNSHSKEKKKFCLFLLPE